MDPWWVRCGHCSSFASPLTSSVIFLTSCGHFVCNHCLHKSPLPKPSTTGYCYDCKKPCSVVNLSLGDKLSPDIVFYFKDLTSLLQKMIEIENFQKLHRNRYMEGVLRRYLMEDIIKVQLYRERCDKYMPFFGQIQGLLCSKYGVTPTKERTDFSPAQIDAFVEELQAFQRHQGTGTPSYGGREVDNRTPSRASSNQVTPMMQGSPAGGGVTVGRNARPPSSLFRTHAQNGMCGGIASQPLSGPSMLGSRVTPGAGGRIGLGSGGRPPMVGGSGCDREFPVAGSNPASGASRLPSSTGGSRITPTARDGRITPTSGGSRTSGGGRVTPTSGGGRITPVFESRRTTPVTSGGRRVTPTTGGGGRITPLGGGVKITPGSGGRGEPNSAGVGRITPTGRTKPSPLLSSSRAIAQSVPSQRQQQANRPPLQPPPTFTQQQANRPHQPPPIFTPTHARIRQVMLSGGPPKLTATPSPTDQRSRGMPVMSVSRAVPMVMGPGLTTPMGLGQRSLTPVTARGPKFLGIPSTSRLQPCKFLKAGLLVH